MRETHDEDEACPARTYRFPFDGHSDEEFVSPTEKPEVRAMRIASLFNTTLEHIESRRWNPYLGISINNKKFTREYLYDFMAWAAVRTKERVAIVIVDIIQHINNLVFDRSKPISAIDKAFRKAEEVRLLCDQAMSALPPQLSEKIVLLDWTDIVYDPFFCHNLQIFKEEYAENDDFRNALIAITKKNLGSIVSRLDEDAIETLSRYLLNELPELATGFMHDGIHYNLNVYPGRIGSIYSELMCLDFFPRIYSRLYIIGNIASVEAYSEEAPDG